MTENYYNEVFKDTLDFYNSKILIAYQGVFERQLLGAIAKNLETAISDAALSKRLFRIFIEIAQNIAYYSAEKLQVENKTSGGGILVMKSEGNSILISGGNLINNNSITELESHCLKINTLNHVELRDYKRKELEQRLSFGKESHLGLIQIAILSGNPIKLDFKEIDSEFSFITISSKIDF